MDAYNIDELYSTVVKNFWNERHRANATGGKNNIRAKGDGPEKVVRDWIASVIGKQYRVTEGHVVNANGQKSKQMDVVIVWDAAIGTLYGSKSGEPELVRAECVAAVGEIKSSWYEYHEVLKNYSKMVREIECLQKGLLVKNRSRFGKIQNDTSLAEMIVPITGRSWLNKCYSFVIALELGKCDLKNLANDLMKDGVKPVDASAVILDEKIGGAICMPRRAKQNATNNMVGMECEVYRKLEEVEMVNSWTTLQETISPPEIAAGRLLHLFLSDLQLHLSTWSWEFRDPRHYVKLNSKLRRRHPNEKSK